MGNPGEISVSEVATHAKPDDCWVVVNGKVYDLTEFAPKHPGGPEIIHKFAGKDGSKTYNTFHAADLIENELSDDNKKGPVDESSVDQKWLDAQKEEAVSIQPNADEQTPLVALVNLDDFEKSFARTGAKKANAYISSASNDLISLNANKEFWQKLWFRPRVMRNVSIVNTKMKMLGQEVSMPVFICPMGVAKIAGDEGELALGAGAAKSGIIHCTAITASYSTEEVLASTAKTHPFFFQLYVDRERHKSEALLKRVGEMDQIKALFVTVDLAVVSKREADERMRSDEVVQSMYSGNNALKPDAKGGGLARTTGGFVDPALSWDDIHWLKKHWKKPIVVKGIQSAADARMAAQLGCAGIVVSNHGGRALDNAPATILILLELRRDCPEVFDQMEVFVDGGVRRGSDILKAVCLGARGVGVGRPFQCSVAYGTAGVEAVAAILQDELEIAMRLCGVTDLESVRGDMQYVNTAELERYLPPKPNTPSRFWSFFRARL